MLKNPEDEKLYLMYEAVSWLDEDGNEVDMVDDRFQSHYVSVETETGRRVTSASPLSETGIGGLSLTDAVTLGFSTAEYRTITLVEWIEERYVKDENDLNEAREHPPIPWDVLRAKYDQEYDDHSSLGGFRP